VSKVNPVFDESAAGLLATELTFSCFSTIMTASFTIIGGAIILKGALIPSAPVTDLFLIGIGLLAVAAVSALEGQFRTIINPERRQARSLYRRVLLTVGPGTMGLGTGVLFAYFLNNFG
jgi:hypothetical protein